MKNKAKDGGDLVWLYIVSHKRREVVLVTAAKDDAEVRSIFNDMIQDDGYRVEDLVFDRIGERRFSRKIARKRINSHIKFMVSLGADVPLYNRE